MKHFIIILFIFFTACVEQTTEKNLILRNAHVITMNAQQHRAQMVVIAGNLIVYVGQDSESHPFINENSWVIDLQGKTLIPGFIEGHAHLWGLGDFLINIDLSGIANWDEAIQLIHTAAQKIQPGQWILGRGWHQEKWYSVPANAVNGYPIHTEISAAAPDNPVLLKHASGHAVLVNQKALDLAGITSATANPDDGIILKDGQGQPTGILLENAMGLVIDVYDASIDSLTDEQQEKYYGSLVTMAAQHCLKNGITSFQDAGSSLREIAVLNKMANNLELPMRLWVMVSAEEELTASLLQDYRMIGAGHNFLTVRAIKQYIDGALGTRGAWMLQPYSDMPSTSGINVTPLDKIMKTAQLAYENDYQLCTHAIGDRGNREILNIYQQVLQSQTNKRWRMEHAQHLSAEDIPRFAGHGIIASFQTVHCTSDGPWVPARIGDKRAEQGAYVWQKVLQTGAHLANGTDAPVERINAIENFYAAVTRRLNDGSQFYPQQVLSREQALASLTIWNAYAAFEEDIKGSIEPGKLADLVVLSQNILEIPEEQILKTTVDITILDGKIVFER